MNIQYLAKEILENVGTESNIKSLTHCVTRLRFSLFNDGKANKNNIENLDGVISVVESGGQFQVVIGNKVGDVYKEIGKLTNSEDINITKDKVVKEKSRIGSKALDFISSIFAPVLNILRVLVFLKDYYLSLFILIIYQQTVGPIKLYMQ